MIIARTKSPVPCLPPEGNGAHHVICAVCTVAGRAPVSLDNIYVHCLVFVHGAAQYVCNSNFQICLRISDYCWGNKNTVRENSRYKNSQINVQTIANKTSLKDATVASVYQNVLRETNFNLQTRRISPFEQKPSQCGAVQHH